MPHHYELTMTDETATQPRIKVSWLIGTLAAFAIFVVIANYSVRMTQTYPDFDQGRADVRYDNLAKVRKAENALLNPALDAQGLPHAEWADQTKGIVRIPIDQAMAQEVDILKSQPAGMGGEIVGVAPAAAAAPAAPPTVKPAAKTGAPTAPAAKTNAASAKPSAPAKQNEEKK